MARFTRFSVMTLKSLGLFAAVVFFVAAKPRKDAASSASVTSVAPVNQPQKSAYHALPLGAVTPSGWLETTLKAQVDGITGHLDEIYPLVMGSRNGWLGGDGDQWERGPYWIDGLLPAAYMLGDDALKAKVQPWVEWMLASQTDEGQFGPAQDYPSERGIQTTKHDDWWPRMVALKILVQHYEATGDARVMDFLGRYFRYQLETLPEKVIDFSTFWALYRACDNLDVVMWYYEKTHEAWLLDLGRLIVEQSYNFTEAFTTRASEFWTPESIHCVNLAQGMKMPAVTWMLTGDDAHLKALRKGFDDLTRHYGWPTGMYGADETLHSASPTQGSELCTTVEMMYSLERILAICGDTFYADRLERVAYNSLPTQTTPDFTLRQYYQQLNQVQISEDPHNFDCHDRTGNLYGLLTGYPCCTANLHQGWPKFIRSLFFEGAQGSLAALVYGPCKVNFTRPDGSVVKITERTAYPFEGHIEFHFESAAKGFELQYRIPSWATSAVVMVNGSVAASGTAGSICSLKRNWAKGDVLTLDFGMEIVRSRWYERSMCIERGPLVYAMPIGENWVRKETKPSQKFSHGGSYYYEVYPTTPWNYALVDAAPCMIVRHSEPVEESRANATRHSEGRSPKNLDSSLRCTSHQNDADALRCSNDVNTSRHSEVEHEVRSEESCVDTSRHSEPVEESRVLPDSSLRYTSHQNDADALRCSNDGINPWTVENAPIRIITKAKRVPSWTMYNGSAGPLPWTPTPILKSKEPAEEIILVPYGCTHLRITEFPVVK